jgi:uncharacterized protein YcbK (DUF882 family)
MLASVPLLVSLLLALSVGLPGAEASKKARYLASKSTAVVHTAAARQPIEVVYARHLHTLEVMPLDAPGMDPAAFHEFLRCWFTEDHAEVPTDLVGRILEAAHHFGAREVQIVSAFRHPKYNAILRKKGREVARDSTHTRGQAVDFRLVGVATESLRAFVRARHDGGVGVYRHSGFVHIDTGKKRSWTGR